MCTFVTLVLDIPVLPGFTCKLPEGRCKRQHVSVEQGQGIFERNPTGLVS